MIAETGDFARSVTAEIERCSAELHRLTRRRALLLEASRRLAVGFSPAVVEVELREVGIEVDANRKASVTR